MSFGNVFASGTARSQANAIFRESGSQIPGMGQGNNPLAAWNASLRQTSSTISGLRNLSTAAQPLRMNGQAWNAGEAVSSDRSVVTASMNGQRTSLTYDVNVRQTAQSQRSESAGLAGSERNQFEPGRNTLSLTAGGRTFNVTANIREDDTNTQALGRMADAINGAGSGVRASVVTEEGESRLVLEGQTGERNTFSLNGPVETENTREARDAQFTVQGQERSSDSNNVSIANGRIQLQLQGEGSATVSSRQDRNRIVSSAESFINAFNQSVRDLSAMPRSSQVQQVQNRMGLSNFNASQMARIGITMNSDRTMSIDNERLTRALEDDPSRTRRLMSQMANQADNAFRSAQNLRSAPRDTSQFMNYLQSGLAAGLSGSLVLDLMA
jgi:flagellar hook-associated protein 2